MLHCHVKTRELASFAILLFSQGFQTREAEDQLGVIIIALARDLDICFRKKASGADGVDSTRRQRRWRECMGRITSTLLVLCPGVGSLILRIR